MGDNKLSDEQSARLQNLLKAQLAIIRLDDTACFVHEWAQIVREHENVVLSQATEFLNPAQIEMLKKLAAADLGQMASGATRRRKALGIR